MCVHLTRQMFHASERSRLISSVHFANLMDTIAYRRQGKWLLWLDLFSLAVNNHCIFTMRGLLRIGSWGSASVTRGKNYASLRVRRPGSIHPKRSLRSHVVIHIRIGRIVHDPAHNGMQLVFC